MIEDIAIGASVSSLENARVLGFIPDLLRWGRRYNAANDWGYLQEFIPLLRFIAAVVDRLSWYRGLAFCLQTLLAMAGERSAQCNYRSNIRRPIRYTLWATYVLASFTSFLPIEATSLLFSRFDCSVGSHSTFTHCLCFERLTSLLVHVSFTSHTRKLHFTSISKNSSSVSLPTRNCYRNLQRFLQCLFLRLTIDPANIKWLSRQM